MVCCYSAQILCSYYVCMVMLKFLSQFCYYRSTLEALIKKLQCRLGMPPKNKKASASAATAATKCDLCTGVIKNGEDTLQCSGTCQGYVHRYCAGVTVKHYQELIDNSTPFCCLLCTQQSHSAKINDFQNEISSLRRALQEKAALFNEFFHSVFTHSHFNLPPSYSLSQPPHCIDNACISQLNVLEALQCLTSDKSSGLNRIGPKLLKNCALALYIPIHQLFSLSLASHTIPSEWKIHSITPIHKSLVSNYRPISLLCIISKVLERIIYNHLSKFLLEQNLIYISQFGVSGKSGKRI